MTTSPRAILVVRYSALGDVVLATSVLQPLRERFPEARIEWVTDPAFVPLLEGLPELAAVHPLHRDAPEGALALRERLRGRFDVVLDLQGKVRSAVVARTAAPRRLVFRRRTPGQALLSLMGHDPVLQRAHATRLYAEVLAPLGVGLPGPLRIHLSSRARGLADDALRGLCGKLVAIAPGARWATKRWPAQSFARVADELAAGGARIVLAGGPGDREALEGVRSAMRAPVAADLSPLPLDALAAAIGRMRLLVANDSGPVHLASALGIPTLAVFGPTSPVRWGPPAPSRAVALGIACAPCSNHGAHVCPRGHHRCLADLDPRTVLEAARELLG